MKSSLRFLLAVGLLASTSVTAYARIERVVEKTFTVTGPGTLHVETHGGGVQVSASSDRTVRVVAKQKIRAETDAEADELLQKLELTIEQDGNDVKVVSKHERKPLGLDFGSWPPVQVDFAISVPADFATDLRTSGGGISIGDLNGKVEARTSGGSIKLGKITAQVNARTSGGSITLAAASGPVDLETSGGSITVGHVAGPAELSTSGGGIKIDSVIGALRAKTSGGSIRASITGPLSDDCELSTSGGSVRIDVDKSAAFQLDAATSGGSVDAGGLVGVALGNRSSLGGPVNGGGPRLKLRTSGGSIVVRAN